MMTNAIKTIQNLLDRSVRKIGKDDEILTMEEYKAVEHSYKAMLTKLDIVSDGIVGRNELSSVPLNPKVVNSFEGLETWLSYVSTICGENTPLSITPMFDRCLVEVCFNPIGDVSKATIIRSGGKGEDVTDAISIINSVKGCLPKLDGVDSSTKNDILAGKPLHCTVSMVTEDILESINRRRVELKVPTYVNERAYITDVLKHPSLNHMFVCSLYRDMVMEIHGVSSDTTSKYILIEDISDLHRYGNLTNCSDVDLLHKVEDALKLDDVTGHTPTGVMVHVANIEDRDLISTDDSGDWCVVLNGVRAEGASTLSSIVWHVGHDGVLYATGNIYPIMLDGKECKEVALGSSWDVEINNISIGESLAVKLGTDGRAHGYGVVTNKISNIKQPRICPSCGSVLGGASRQLRCINRTSCKGQLTSTIVYICRRDILDIRSITSSMAHTLVYTGRIQTVSDLLTAPEEVFDAVGGHGSRVVRDIEYMKGRATPCMLLQLIRLPVSSDFIAMLAMKLTTAKEVIDLLEHLEKTDISKLDAYMGILKGYIDNDVIETAKNIAGIMRM